jgi:hypothetical protein
MKILTLIIKQVYFDQILNGTKTQEFREIKPSTEKKYVDSTGIKPKPILYDAIRFYVGYHTNRDTALVAVQDASVNYFVTEITYDLGKILESTQGDKGSGIIDPEQNKLMSVPRGKLLYRTKKFQ